MAAASPVPVIAYNVPSRTGRDLGAAGLLEIAAVPNIAGVKQAVATLDADTLEVLANAPEGFAVLGGEDTLLFPLMCMGAVGTISAAAHLCTERFVAMIECGLAGKIDDGRAHAEALLPVIRAAYVDPNPAVFKGVLHAQGRIATPDVRLPLTNGSAEAVAAASMRSPTRRTRSLGGVSRRVAWFLIALCAWTLYIWITLIVIIGRQDHPLGLQGRARHPRRDLDGLRPRRRLRRPPRPPLPRLRLGAPTDVRVYGAMRRSLAVTVGRREAYELGARARSRGRARGPDQ